VFLIGFPLLLIPLTIFNIIVFMMPGLRLDTAVGVVPLMSGKTLPLTLGDALVLLSIVLLLVEVVKAARPGAKYVMDHFLSLLVFAGAAAELILLPQDAFASIPFAFVVALMFVDAVGGPMIGWRRRRVERQRTRVEPAEVARVEPQPAAMPARAEPIPAPLPAAEPVSRVQPPPLPQVPPAAST
jgi:hypothetical protein